MFNSYNQLRLNPICLVPTEMIINASQKNAQDFEKYLQDVKERVTWMKEQNFRIRDVSALQI